MWNCKHCSKSFDFQKTSDKANHSRWCKKNPKRKEYESFLEERRKQFLLTEPLLKRGNSIKQAWRDGKYKDVVKKQRVGFKHTEETKKTISEKARASKHRRLKKGCVIYKGILMDSSWEVLLAERLDSLNVKWVRPDPISWIDDEGKQHNYFPDFFLPEYDIYLDPKNPYAYQTQINKLEKLKTTLTNLIILTSISEIKNYVP